MKRQSEVFCLVATMLAGALWLPVAAQGATVPAGFVLAQHVDYRARMEREAAGYVRAGYQALKRGQLQKARAWFLKAKKLFPGHKGANAGLRQVKAAEARARRRAAAVKKRKQWLAGFTSCVRANGRLKTCTNSIGMKFRLIPAGSFMMGSPSNELRRYSDEGPQHRVVISRPFYLQTTEVTQAQYRAITGTNPSHFKNCDRCPVEQVSWNDAQEFIRKLNAWEKTNKYRLPTEAEWEYACRAGTTTAYYFGNNSGSLGAYAWHRGNSGHRTRPVFGKRPNRWGLYDMHGNVWEWCSDWYGKNYYSNSPTRDPRGPSSGSGRVLVGGSWYNYPGTGNLRSAIRGGKDPRSRYFYFGFRVLRMP